MSDIELNKLKLSVFVDDFLVDNIRNITCDFVGLNDYKITCNVDKLSLEQYFPKINDVNYMKLQIDDVGKYSITLPKCANIITKLIQSYCNNIDKKIVVTDATAGVGGNTISFASHKFEVNAVEIDKSRFDILKNNINEYGFDVNLYNENYLDIYDKLQQDVIFMDPPWGGVDYKTHNDITLKLGDMSIEKLCNIIFEKKLAKITVLKLPYNYDLNSIKHEIHIPFTLFKAKKLLIMVILNEI